MMCLMLDMNKNTRTWGDPWRRPGVSGFMASPYGHFRGADPGRGSLSPGPPISSPKGASTSSGPIQRTPSFSQSQYEGLQDDISMIYTDKIHLLTHTSPEAVYSLQVYNAEVLSEELLISEGLTPSSGEKNAETLAVVEEVKFGFGLVFRLAGKCEVVRLHFHETLYIDGHQHSGYSEFMGTFYRMAGDETAYYYSPREAMFAAEARHLMTNPELEISIRTEAGVELFIRRWALQINPEKRLSDLNFGKLTKPVDSAPSTPSSTAPPAYTGPNLSSSSSCDSVGIESFVELDEKELVGVYGDAAGSPVAAGEARNPNVLQQMGMWLYGSRLGQYVARNIDQGSRVPKTAYRYTPIWLLGIIYDLKGKPIISTLFILFDLGCEKDSNFLQFVPARSETALTYPRIPYNPKNTLMRRIVFRCHSCTARSLLDAVAQWALAHGWAVRAREDFFMAIAKADCTLDLRVFSFQGLILQIDLRASSLIETASITMLSEMYRHLYLKLNYISPVPIVKDWRGRRLNAPDSDVAHVTRLWKQGSSSDPKGLSQGPCLVWDSSSEDWIEAMYSLSLYGNVAVFSSEYSLLEQSMRTISFKASGDLITLIEQNGRETHLFIENIPARCDFSAKLYVHIDPASKPIKAPSSIYIQAFELNRLHALIESKLESEQRTKGNASILQEFMLDFSCRFWFTYRRNMPRLANTIINTDAGWGCLVRCGQMMVAEAYSRILMGRGWNFMQIEMGGIPPEMYQSILGLFEDQIAPTAPFGLHALVLAGAAHSHPVGQWFSPTLLALVCSEQSRRTFPLHFLILAIQNGMLSMSHLRQALSHQPIMLMIPMRLGVEEFNPYYLDLLTGSLQLSQSLGIIGGRPGKCFHIVGHQDKELFYLDPHVTKDPPPSPLECLITREFHTDVVLSMDYNQLDPSLLFGFLIRDHADLDAFLADLTKLNLKSPVFSFMP